MKRILVIDDDPLQREWLKVALEDAEYEVLEASDGTEGVRIYQKYPCDVVLTDMYMPEKDGIETIFDLKSQYPAVKIIAMSGGGLQGGIDHSGKGTEVTLKAARDFGADDVLYKPIKFKQLVAMLEKMVNREQ